MLGHSNCRNGKSTAQNHKYFFNPDGLMMPSKKYAQGPGESVETLVNLWIKEKPVA